MKKLASFIIPCLLIALISAVQVVEAESFFRSENTVSTGKVIINGVDMSADFKGVVGSGVRAKKLIKTEAFSKITIAGGFDVEYQPGNFSVEIEGDDNLIDLPRLTVQQDTLFVSINQSYKTEQTLIVRIFSPRLEVIKVNGSSHVILKNVSGEKLLVDLAGTVDLLANGKVAGLELKLEGSGDADASQLQADIVTVTLNGSGDAKVNAQNELNASVFGVGDIVYFGQPKKITRKIVGVGDIEPD